MSNEMNNQAAQTMPSVDAFMAKWEWLILSRCRDEFRADLAALSQTAGVVAGWRAVDDVSPPLGRLGPYLVAGGDYCVIAQGRDSAGKILEQMTGKPIAFVAEKFAPLDAVLSMLAAAPAASGAHPDALPDGTLSKSTAKRVEVLAAASVSERARELVTELYGDKAVFTRHDVARALEQALTQQRVVQLGDFQDKALAWDAVCEILNVVHPNWHANGRTGMQAAIITIQKLAHTTPQPSADAVREYDRELIARMLLGPRVFSPESVAEQARLLREAENLEVDARTVVRTAASGEKGVESDTWFADMLRSLGTVTDLKK